MALSLETIRCLQPEEWLSSLEGEARSQILDEGARLMAWQRARSAVAELEAMLGRVASAAEGAEQRLGQAGEAVSGARVALREAEESLERAVEAEREARYPPQEPIRAGSIFDPYARGPMARGGATPRFREDDADIAALQRQVQDAQRELQRVEGEQERAETAWRSAQERASACRRFLEGLRGIERPETPALDLLWDLMGGSKEGGR